jgi:hypothetical protein
MQRRVVIAAVPALAAAALGGCGQQIYDSGGGPFTGVGGLDVRRRQIDSGAAGLGWQLNHLRPGVARAMLSLRTHVAVVEIAYDETRFTIRYVSSDNLGYTGTSIHRNYNGWIRNLERAISQQPVP